jgi:hypothetical protein
MSYERIKKVADEALALQNKLYMEGALRAVSALCTEAMAMDADQFEAAELAQHEAAKTKKGAKK